VSALTEVAPRSVSAAADAVARAIAHVDMDAFYASIEQRDRPELRGRPVIVGASPGGRGVVSAASYEARPFGVHSAMPISRAARLCPHAAFVPVDMEKYQRVSVQVMEILADFSPLVEPVSVDEAFVDLTGTEPLFGTPIDAVRRIKERNPRRDRADRVGRARGEQVVAKVASELKKPDGLVVVPAGDEARFLGVLPVERLWGRRAGDVEGAPRPGFHHDRAAAEGAARGAGQEIRQAWRSPRRPRPRSGGDRPASAPFASCAVDRASSRAEGLFRRSIDLRHEPNRELRRGGSRARDRGRGRRGLRHACRIS